MAKRTIVLVLALALAGCVTGKPGAAGSRVVGDADHVSVEGSRWDALPLAVIHCSRFSRSAVFDHAEGGRSVFRCVANPETPHPPA